LTGSFFILPFYLFPFTFSLFRVLSSKFTLKGVFVMKGIGFAAVAALVVSFFLWLISYSYWTYQQFQPYDSAKYESEKAIRYVVQGIGVVSTLTEYLAILLIAVAVIMAAKRLPKF
jgi:hypothetical protein